MADESTKAHLRALGHDLKHATANANDLPMHAVYSAVVGGVGSLLVGMHMQAYHVQPIVAELAAIYVEARGASDPASTANRVLEVFERFADGSEARYALADVLAFCIGRLARVMCCEQHGYKFPTAAAVEDEVMQGIAYLLSAMAPPTLSA
ncbi:MAG TPA: hypothetical protein VF183_05620 [Acidimicrobiales bacterium]